MKISKNNKGFSLLELILVLGLSSLAFIAFLNTEKKRTETMTCEAGGQQFEEVGKALSTYISIENKNLKNNFTAGTTQVMPISVLQGTNSTPYIGRQLLPDTFSNTNIFGNNFILVINRSATGDIFKGLVITSAAVTDPSGAIKYDCLGAAMKKAGSQSGMTFMSTNTLSGLNGSWTIPSTTFPQINAMGQFGYRAQYQNNFDDTYLRTDGSNYMIGDLDVGNYSVKNATDITYDGWLYGQQALINSLRTGVIQNAGNIDTKSISGWNSAASTSDNLLINNSSNRNVVIGSAFGIGTPSLPASPNGDGNLYVKDIYLRGGTGGPTNRTINAWLSDRLPKYSSRGAVLITVDASGNNFFTDSGGTLTPTSGVNIPTCGSGGSGKIEVVPQVMWVQGRVEGTGVTNPYSGVWIPGSGLALGASSTYGLQIEAFQNQWSRGGFAAYAQVVGSVWRINLKTGAYAPGSVGGTALAHVYCSYAE